MRSNAMRQLWIPAALLGVLSTSWAGSKPQELVLRKPGLNPDAHFRFNVLQATYTSADEESSHFTAENLRPVSLTSTDFNGDGYPDIAVGYASESGGVIVVHLANPEAFSPSTPDTLANVRRAIFPPAFRGSAIAIRVAAAPDYLAAGDFCRDSHPSIVFATKGERSLSVVVSDGNAHFEAGMTMLLPGKITALTTGSMRANDGAANVIAGVESDSGAQLALFEAHRGGVCSSPRTVPMSSAASEIAIGDLDGDGYADIALISGGQLQVLYGRTLADTSQRIRFEAIPTQHQVQAIAIGAFEEGFRARNEIAFLDGGGALRISGRRNGRWEVLAANLVTNPERAKLTSARLTGGSVDDLIVTVPMHARVSVYRPSHTTLAVAGELRELFLAGHLTLDSAPLAVLPMRLNVMGSNGIVMLLRDSIEPFDAPPQPVVTYHVTTLSDSSNGSCSPPSGTPAISNCTTLRAAVIAANLNTGQDMIVFDVNGSITLSVPGADDNAATGDLDVTDALTIVGNGAANTVIQGGPNASSGIDKVFSFNPNGIQPGFPVSLSGLTIQYGLNSQINRVNTNTDGGAFDFSAGMDDGFGSLAIANCNILQNGTTNGHGGGLALYSGGTITITGTTISGNQARRQGTVDAGRGGGIYIGNAWPFAANITISNSSISNNTASTPGQSTNYQDGGGIYSRPGVEEALTYAFGVTFHYNSVAIHASSVSNNQADGQGGGLSGRFVIDQNSLLSGNTASGSGGGIFGWFSVNHSVLLNNSSGTAGGTLYADDSGASINNSRFRCN
jgi:hypothetical protein